MPDDKMGRRNLLKGLSLSAAGTALGACQSQRPAGQAPVADVDERIHTQVCVIGGGSGGIGAALAAARAGAEVVLVERESILGGTSTMAWVHSWEPTVGADGIPRDLYGEMRKDPLAVTYPDYQEGSSRQGPLPGDRQGGGHGLPFEPRALSFAARTLLEATGRCQVLLGTTFYRAHLQDDKLTAVEAWYHGRHLLIEADLFIDCTADGDLCVDAGCEYHLGEDPFGRYLEPSAPAKATTNLNACTLLYRVTDTGVRQKPLKPSGMRVQHQWGGVHIIVLPNGDHAMNALGMVEGDMLLHTEHSQLMHEAYLQVLDNWHYLQTLPPGKSTWNRLAGPDGYATWSIVGVAPRLGIRETRRIVGDYVLRERDCLKGLSEQGHDDIIAITDHAVDIHGSNHRIYEVPKGAYGVPYRCLLPKGVANLFIASRAASFSHIAASSCRLCRTVMTLGQAAGTAAALCVQEGIRPREVDMGDLQASLRAQNVALS